MRGRGSRSRKFNESLGLGVHLKVIHLKDYRFFPIEDAYAKLSWRIEHGHVPGDRIGKRITIVVRSRGYYHPRELLRLSSLSSANRQKESIASVFTKYGSLQRGSRNGPTSRSRQGVSVRILRGRPIVYLLIYLGITEVYEQDPSNIAPWLSVHAPTSTGTPSQGA